MLRSSVKFTVSMLSGSEDCITVSNKLCKQQCVGFSYSDAQTSLMLLPKGTFCVYMHHFHSNMVQGKHPGLPPKTFMHFKSELSSRKS